MNESDSLTVVNGFNLCEHDQGSFVHILWRKNDGGTLDVRMICHVKRQGNGSLIGEKGIGHGCFYCLGHGLSSF